MGKKCWMLALLALCAVTLVSCSRKKVLNVYTWCDYFAPSLLTEFEKQFDCRVQINIFDSNEMMYAKLQAGSSGYDVIVPTHYFINKMAKSGLIVKLDQSQLPNLKHVDPMIMEKLGADITSYAVPYLMSYTGLGYNKSKIKDFEPSWNIFQREDLKGRMTLLDDYSEVIGAAMLTQGLTQAEVNDPEKGAAAKEKILKQVLTWRPNVIKFENEQYKNGLAAGEFLVVMGYFSDIGQVVSNDPENLAFCMPKEGCLFSCDTLVISSNAKEPELAYAFVNFMHEPENAAVNIEEICAYSPNLPAVELLPEEVKNDPAIFIDPAIIARSEFLKELTQEEEDLYLELWSKIKAGIDDTEE